MQAPPNIVQYGPDVSPQSEYEVENDVSDYVVQIVQIKTSGTLFAMSAVFNNTAPVTVILWRPFGVFHQVVWKMTVTPSSLNTTEYVSGAR
jgi:hypothetical protein